MEASQACIVRCLQFSSHPDCPRPKGNPLTNSAEQYYLLIVWPPQGEMVEIAGMLPHDSPIRNSVQAKTVATLYNSLQHPPESYLGEKHQYRTADGSYHVRNS